MSYIAYTSLQCSWAFHWQRWVNCFLTALQNLAFCNYIISYNALEYKDNIKASWIRNVFRTFVRLLFLSASPVMSRLTFSFICHHISIIITTEALRDALYKYTTTSHIISHTCGPRLPGPPTISGAWCHLPGVIFCWCRCCRCVIISN